MEGHALSWPQGEDAGGWQIRRRTRRSASLQGIPHGGPRSLVDPRGRMGKAGPGDGLTSGV